MKKILFVNTKENIEMSYPDWVSPFIDIISKYIKVKTVKLDNGSKFRKESIKSN